jgi:glycosyltransferase involved in cell wall biosynthesis
LEIRRVCCSRGLAHDSFTDATVVIAMGAFGIVAIGRNEGARLAACFRSLRAVGDLIIVYVDSGSTDTSLNIAEGFGVNALSLDMSSPFSAARARNLGANYLRKEHPSLRYIQFIDGDCLIEEGWLNAASSFLDINTNCAAVVGHLKELFPEASVYNLLCSLEWSSKAGEITNFGGFGGISMVRLSVFTALGGFREEVIAGEDSEFAVRAFLLGHEIRKLDTAMAQHDADIHSFCWATQFISLTLAWLSTMQTSTHLFSGGSDPKDQAMRWHSVFH